MARRSVKAIGRRMRVMAMPREKRMRIPSLGHMRGAMKAAQRVLMNNGRMK